MYVRRIQLMNYGPIPQLDIQFPFSGDVPKPVVLVGENGSGKSIVLSHIVNALVAAKSSAYPESAEVQDDKVYKLRSSAYIRSGAAYYLARVELDDNMFVNEGRVMGTKQSYPNLPEEHWSTELQELWRELPDGQGDHYKTSFPGSSRLAERSSREKIQQMFSGFCVLYLPSNRFEEPAWLNAEHLNARAQHLDLSRHADQTDREIISSSPLRENQNWLYEVVFDRAVFELQTRQLSLPIDDTEAARSLRVFSGFQGEATSMFELCLQVVRILVGQMDVRFTIGTRHDRVLSLESRSGFRVQNVFHLSSGESALLNIFLSVLRDYDLSGATFSSANDVRGIVVIDEVDLHLHVRHQRTVLPTLMKMFPGVQFVVTTHSPLFVLGMREEFGEGGFALFRTPEGQMIGAEEFGEFGAAYEALQESQRAREVVKEAVEAAQRPVVFVEGPTDVQYLNTAADVLGRRDVLEGIVLRVGGSDSKLDAIWRAHANVMKDASPIRIVLLYDWDARQGRGGRTDEGKVSRRFVPRREGHPIAKGVENLFSLETLEWAREKDPELFEITRQHSKMVGSEERVVSEQWVVRSGDKQALCDLICARGDKGDFSSFADVLQMIDDAVS